MRGPQRPRNLPATLTHPFRCVGSETGAGTGRAGNAKAEDPAPANKKAALATGHSAKVPTAAPDRPSFCLLFFGKWEVQRDTFPLWEGAEMEGRQGKTYG